jgi:uncharacterized protein with PQ loop repeat
MELITNTLGFMYTCCFALCFIPQIVKTIISKSVDNVSVSVYYISLTGYISALSYTLLKVGLDFWLQINFVLSGIASSVMIFVYHKYKNREVVVNKVVRNIRVD